MDQETWEYYFAQCNRIVFIDYLLENETDRQYFQKCWDIMFKDLRNGENITKKEIDKAFEAFESKFDVKIDKKIMTSFNAWFWKYHKKNSDAINELKLKYKEMLFQNNAWAYAAEKMRNDFIVKKPHSNAADLYLEAWYLYNENKIIKGDLHYTHEIALINAGKKISQYQRKEPDYFYSKVKLFRTFIQRYKKEYEKYFPNPNKNPV